MFPLVEVPPICTLSPLQIAVAEPVIAEGVGFTVIVVLSDFLQPVAVTVSVR